MLYFEILMQKQFPVSKSMFIIFWNKGKYFLIYSQTSTCKVNQLITICHKSQIFHLFSLSLLLNINLMKTKVVGFQFCGSVSYLFWIVIFIVLPNSYSNFLDKKCLHLCDFTNFYFRSVHIQKLQKNFTTVTWFYN